MKQVIIIHGATDENEFFGEQFPSLSNANWFPWIQKQLIIRGILAQTPEMSVSVQPDYGHWKQVFGQFSLDNQTILVGHSCGGGFLIRYLSEKPINLNKLILIAPWLDPSRRLTTSFFDFSINPEIQNCIEKIEMLYSADDPVEGVKESVEKIKLTLPKVVCHNFTNKGHFSIEEMKTEKFPELLKIIILK